MNEQTKAVKQTRWTPTILTHLFRQWTLSPVSFSIELDQRELDDYLMEPESR